MADSIQSSHQHFWDTQCATSSESQPTFKLASLAGLPFDPFGVILAACDIESAFALMNTSKALRFKGPVAADVVNLMWAYETVDRDVRTVLARHGSASAPQDEPPLSHAGMQAAWAKPVLPQATHLDLPAFKAWRRALGDALATPGKAVTLAQAMVDQLDPGWPRHDRVNLLRFTIDAVTGTVSGTVQSPEQLAKDRCRVLDLLLQSIDPQPLPGILGGNRLGVSLRVPQAEPHQTVETLLSSAAGLHFSSSIAPR